MKKAETGIPYYVRPGRKLDGDPYTGTAKVTADTTRVDRLKEQLRSTEPELDFERVRIMYDMYEETAGEHQQLRRAKFLAAVLDRKKLYIDDNLFVGAMAGKTNAMYPYPEWQVDWMIEEKTVENSPTPEDKKANQWVSITGANVL